MTKRQTAPQSRYDPRAPRVSKREQLRNARRRRSLIWNVIVLGTLGLFLLSVVGYFLLNRRPGPLPGELVIADEGAAVAPAGSDVTYDHHPPSSGPRYPDAAPWGFSEQPVPEPTFVANLARGGVVFLYRCDEPCPDLEQQFRDLLVEAPPESRYDTVKILVSPYAGQLEKPIVALAWNHQLELDAFNEASLLRWYRRFVNLGPDVGP